jgi:uncharacterized protein
VSVALLGKFAIGIATFIIALTALLFFFQRQLIFPAPQTVLAAPPSGYRFVETRTADGLALRAAFREAAPGKPTLLFFHGNADSISGADAATRALVETGYGAMLVEYRGYGGNPGSPSEAGFYADAEAAMAWLARQGIAPANTVIVGNSIGSGPATEMAVRHQPAALVLISGFASLPIAASDVFRVLPTMLLLRDRFDNAAKIGRVRGPILILHGDADTIVRPHHADLLSDAAPKATRIIVPGAGHELAYLPESQARILEWLAAR